MAQSLLSTLKILLALLASATLAGLLAGFLYGRNTGNKASLVVLGIGTVLALLQIVELRFWPVVLAGTTLAGGLLWRLTRSRGP